jgi:hypothetical protein
MRNKRPVVLLATLFCSSFAIIALLAFLSKNMPDKKNGFNRRLLPTTLQVSKQVTFPVVINKIMGAQGGKLYFQGASAYEVYTTNLFLGSPTRIPLSITPDKKIRSGFQMFLHERHVYIACRNLPGIIDYDLDSQKCNTHVLPYFYSKETSFAKDGFILRANDRKTKDPVFVKLHLNRATERQEDRFSTKTGASNFATDGFLYYDAGSNLACYSYFYQNGFICMDTNLNLLVKARTIDTITKREIQVAHVGSSLTMKQPPVFVNSVVSLSAGTLYLQSMLKADNELPLDFAENTVIDAYSVTNGNYIASFYIPPYKGNKPYMFNVIDKKLYAIYGKTVVVYDLPAI